MLEQYTENAKGRCATYYFCLTLKLIYINSI